MLKKLHITYYEIFLRGRRVFTCLLSLCACVCVMSQWWISWLQTQYGYNPHHPTTTTSTMVRMISSGVGLMHTCTLLEMLFMCTWSLTRSFSFIKASKKLNSDPFFICQTQWNNWKIWWYTDLGEGTDWYCHLWVAIVLCHILQRVVIFFTCAPWNRTTSIFFCRHLLAFWNEVNSVRTTMGWLISLGSLWLHVNATYF